MEGYVILNVTEIDALVLCLVSGVVVLVILQKLVELFTASIRQENMKRDETIELYHRSMERNLTGK